MNETITVDGVQIPIKLSAGENFALLVQDLDFNFRDLLEIRGDFRLTGDTFSGDDLEIFVG